jgi:hypothetical protein
LNNWNGTLYTHYTQSPTSGRVSVPYSIDVGIIRQTSCGIILIDFFEDARKEGGVAIMEEKRYTD